jgi:hypothetical protein
MKVTRELIERYLTGMCTDQEREAVALWLASPDHEETNLSDDTLEDMALDIWGSLETYLPEGRDTIRAGWWSVLPRLAVAACISVGLVGLSFFFAYKNAHTEIAFSSYGMDDEMKGAARPIAFSLKPNSSVSGSISRYAGQGHLNFTGSLKMLSEAGSNLEIDFGVRDQSPVLSRKATIEEGQLYYVGVLKQADSPDEILVSNSQQLEDIPPRIKIMAFNDYDI